MASLTRVSGCGRPHNAQPHRKAGPKISQNVNYTQTGTMEGPKAPSEARSAGVPRGVGSGEGRRSPSPVWGSEGIVPRKF